MSKIAIFGTGGHAKVVYDVILKQGQHEVLCFFSLTENLKNFLSLPHYHQDDFAKSEITQGLVAVGDNFLRAKIVNFIKAKKPDFKFITAIHPQAVIDDSSVQFGAGTVVMANVVVNPGANIGQHVILNTACSVDHDTQLEDFSSLAPGCNVGGNVKVEQFASVGLGANVIHGVTVGEHSVIGAGAAVVENVSAYKVAYGVPCREHKTRAAGDKYL